MVRWLSLVLLCLYVHGTVIAMSEWGGDSSLDNDDDPLPYIHRSESGWYSVPSREPSVYSEEAVSPDDHQFEETMDSPVDAYGLRARKRQNLENREKVELELENLQKISRLAESAQDAFRRIKYNPGSKFSFSCTYSSLNAVNVPVNPKDYDMEEPQDILRHNQYNRYYKEYTDVATFQEVFREFIETAKTNDAGTYQMFWNSFTQWEATEELVMEWYIGTLKQRISELSNELQNDTSELRQEGVYW
ncbi:hypothetical protein IWQ62_002335 [Dispira parvispora]|uniref:Uncharacterized protein n=1 Tax=Dispira parvispora TaxID=1520584 RepID=A0A9W8AVW0_9FUNG|nr:hypothetical protein IWQ62_002335 [Dispira parvispora]